MNLNRIYIITLLLITTLSANMDTNIVLYNETLYNNDIYSVKSMYGNKNNKKDIFNNKLRLRLYSNITDKLFFSTTSVYKYSNVDKEYYKNILYNNNYKNNELYFESLYLTYNIINKFYITAGLVNFSNGSYAEISELDYVKGSGLNKIINTPLDAIFLSYSSYLYSWKTLIKIGWGGYDVVNIKTSSAIDKDSHDSAGLYALYEMYNGFDSIKINYYNVDVKKDNLKLANSQAFGIGFNKYFLKKGINIFSTLGYCNNNIDINNIKYYTDKRVGKLPQMMYPNSFVTDVSKTDGYLYSLGINKDFSSDIVESYSIGLDYTYTTDNWYSFVNNDIDDHFNTRYLNGDNFYTWLTVRPTKNIAIKTYYNLVYNKKASSIGNNTVTIDHSDSLRPFLKKMKRYGIKLIVKY